MLKYLLKFPLTTLSTVLISSMVIESNIKLYSEEIKVNLKNNTLIAKNSEEDYSKVSNIIKTSYILGPGDAIYLEFLGLPEFSGIFSIGPDGYMFLPELRDFYAEGYTVKELTGELQKKYSKYVNDPIIYTRVVQYRPVRVYVTGAVPKPGFYTLSNSQGAPNSIELNGQKSNQIELDNSSIFGSLPEISASNVKQVLPTVFDAIRAASGVTSYSDLSKVSVIRKNTKTNGGGKIEAKINFLSLFTEGDQSQNIRVFDGDTITVSKSKFVLREQLLKAKKSNLSPQVLTVYVSGKIISPGAVTVPNGSTLNHAIAIAGGKELLSGKVEFVRFDDDGDLDRRRFSYNSRARVESYKNPLLRSGDVIYIRNSLLGTTTDVLTKIGTPIAASYSFYNLFK